MSEHVSKIEEVVTRLRALEEKFHPDDGVRWFHRLYREVTERLEKQLVAAKVRPTFLERLDVFFANAYFDALAAAGNRDAELADDFRYHAWKPLFEARRRRDVAPIQFALAGMNAHINYDLAVGIERTCVAIDARPARDTAQYDEYQSVNDLMVESERTAELWLLTGALAELNRRFSPVDDVIAVWSLEHARDAAWSRAEVLWALRDQESVEKTFLGVLDRSTGLAGRALLTPVPFIEGRPEVVAPRPIATAGAPG